MGRGPTGRGVHRRWACRQRAIGENSISPPLDKSQMEIRSGTIQNGTWPFRDSDRCTAEEHGQDSWACVAPACVVS